MAKKAKKKSGERMNLSRHLRQEVLMEACYKCAVPVCRNIITLNIHHIWAVADDGPDELANLIALCGYCHDMHHAGHFPEVAIRHWKGMLVALNHAFDPAGMDLLLYLHKTESKMWYSSDGVLHFARLIAADLVTIKSVPGSQVADIGLTPRGRLMVEAWLQGNEDKYKKALAHNDESHDT
jgi:hypothetical protein